MWDLSSLTREPTPTAVEAQSLIHWTTREVPPMIYIIQALSKYLLK